MHVDDAVAGTVQPTEADDEKLERSQHSPRLDLRAVRQQRQTTRMPCTVVLGNAASKENFACDDYFVGVGPYHCRSASWYFPVWPHSSESLEMGTAALAVAGHMIP